MPRSPLGGGFPRPAEGDELCSRRYEWRGLPEARRGRRAGQQAQEPEQRVALSRVVVAEEDVVKAGRGASGFALREASDVLLESAAHKMSKSRGNVVNPVRAKPNHHLIGLSTALTPNPLRETVLPTMPSAVHFPRIVCPLISCRHAAEHGDG